jgi:hypothetical protein
MDHNQPIRDPYHNNQYIRDPYHYNQPIRDPYHNNQPIRDPYHNNQPIWITFSSCFQYSMSPDNMFQLKAEIKGMDHE